ncbi:hypothetical protein VPH35_065758 [Triticum aestivum]
MREKEKKRHPHESRTCLPIPSSPPSRRRLAPPRAAASCHALPLPALPRPATPSPAPPRAAASYPVGAPTLTPSAPIPAASHRRQQSMMRLMTAPPTYHRWDSSPLLPPQQWLPQPRRLRHQPLLHPHKS